MSRRKKERLKFRIKEVTKKKDQEKYHMVYNVGSGL